MDDDLTCFARRHGLGLTRFAYMLCGDRQRAEDLVQSAYLALFRRFAGRMPVEAPVAYARRVIVNENASRSRRRASSELIVAELPDAAGADGVDFGDQDAVWRVLADLPARQRAVLVCRYYLDLPDDDIADLLGARVGTIRSLAARAFATLRTRDDLNHWSMTR